MWQTASSHESDVRYNSCSLPEDSTWEAWCLWSVPAGPSRSSSCCPPWWPSTLGPSPCSTYASSENGGKTGRLTKEVDTFFGTSGVISCVLSIRKFRCIIRQQNTGYNQSVRGCGSQRRQCSCYSTKTHVNSMILILKLNMTSIRNIYIKSGLRWALHTI